jgi:hypothetical protein
VRCFPWLKVSLPQVFLITERLYAVFPPEWETGTSMLTADMERTPEELEQQCRLLTESAALLQRCLDSFPDPDYDYTADAEHPDGHPGSGCRILRKYTQQLDEQLSVWGLSLEETDWVESLNHQLEVLRKRPAFMQNRLFAARDGFCCAGHWLRVQTERCQLTGSRLYTLGISAFGRRSIEDSFHFYG